MLIFYFVQLYFYSSTFVRPIFPKNRIKRKGEREGVLRQQQKDLENMQFTIFRKCHINDIKYISQCHSVYWITSLKVTNLFPLKREREKNYAFTIISIKNWYFQFTYIKYENNIAGFIRGESFTTTMHVIW